MSMRCTDPEFETWYAEAEPIFEDKKTLAHMAYMKGYMDKSFNQAEEDLLKKSIGIRSEEIDKIISEATENNTKESLPWLDRFIKKFKV